MVPARVFNDLVTEPLYQRIDVFWCYRVSKEEELQPQRDPFSQQAVGQNRVGPVFERFCGSQCVSGSSGVDFNKGILDQALHIECVILLSVSEAAEPILPGFRKGEIAAHDVEVGPPATFVAVGPPYKGETSKRAQHGLNKFRFLAGEEVCGALRCKNHLHARLGLGAGLSRVLPLKLILGIVDAYKEVVCGVAIHAMRTDDDDPLVIWVMPISRVGDPLPKRF